MQFEVGQIVHIRYAAYATPGFDPREPFQVSNLDSLYLDEGQIVRVVDVYQTWVKAVTDQQDSFWIIEGSLCDQASWPFVQKMNGFINTPLNDFWLTGNSITLTGDTNWSTNYVYIPTATGANATDYISIGNAPADIGFIRTNTDDKK